MRNGPCWCAAKSGTVYLAVRFLGPHFDSDTQRDSAQTPQASMVPAADAERVSAPLKPVARCPTRVVTWARRSVLPLFWAAARAGAASEG
jgi:hypothetical protein